VVGTKLGTVHDHAFLSNLFFSRLTWADTRIVALTSTDDRTNRRQD
jgi:hypothetical protein